MKDKHTQGPLEVGFYVPTSRFLAVREHVAVMKPGGELVALTGSNDNDETPSSVADATMFCAADDLLKACEALLAVRWDMGMHDSGDGITHRHAGDGAATGCKWCIAKANARAAIAKARGGA